MNRYCSFLALLLAFGSRAGFVALLCLKLPLLNAQDGTQPPAIDPADEPVEISIDGERATVRIGGEPFTELLATGHSSPVLYPVHAPGGQCLVRNYPFRDDVPGEALDHPHHRSIWLGHGDVNGLDYWSGKATIRNRGIESEQPSAIVATNEWLDAERVVCTDRTRIAFYGTAGWRMIDWQSEIRAGDAAVVFGDTKEGTFAIRTHPRLRIHDQNGEPLATAFNSNATEGAAIWGQAAQWVHYAGSIDNQQYAISVLDHPRSFRHPTLWHARDYGLVAANPFARHDMTGAEPGAGAHRLEPAETLLLRYAIVLWRGAPTTDEIEAVYQRFAARD